MKLDTPEKIKTFLEINPTSKIMDGEYVYSIKGGQIHIESRENNSWEYVKTIRSIINENKYPAYIGLEKEWKVLGEYNDKLFDRDKNNAATPLDDFLYTSELGFYPKPEVLMCLANCFERYFNMKGEESLEDIFFGKTQRGIGNQAAKKSRLDAIQTLDFRIMTQQLQLENSGLQEKKSELELAEEVIEMMKLSIDPESLLRKYRRHIKGK
jgi:hypothetical protein